VLDLRVAGVTGVLGGSFLGGVSIAALMVADVPAGAALTAASFGLLGILGTFTRLRDWRAARGVRPRWTSKDRAWMRSAGVRLPEPRERL